MASDREELLEAFQRATAKLKFCPNRVWSIAGEDLPNILPTRGSMTSTLSQSEGQESYSEQNNHELCTFDFCEYSQRDFTAVRQRHECEDIASCVKLRGMFPRGILNEAARHGRPTVWKLTGKTMLESPLPYMAVSHVWSDGTGAGAWRDGEVNECMYEFFRGIAEQFQCQGIWWDTICIPREKTARNKAIGKIQSNYQDARITLVHDCFLRNWEWNPANACFAILMSPWFSRGWTALELAKSSKVKVMFKGCHGPIIKDLDEEILAKDSEPSGPRKAASQIIKNLRKKLTSLNDLLTVLRPRHTSWPKDLATISALLVDVFPHELQQITYINILRKIGRLSPGHLFHHTTTMSAGFSWCPTSLFSLPLDMSDASLIITTDGIEGKWRAKPVEAKLESNCLWEFSHPLTRRLLQKALKHPENYWLLAKDKTGPIKEALLVRRIQDERYEYVGALRFLQRLGVEDIDDWIEKEVTLLNVPDDKTVLSHSPRNRDGEHHRNKILPEIHLVDEGEHETLSDVQILRRGVWRGDHMVVSKLCRRSQLHVPDSLGRWPLHLAAERGDTQMIKLLLQNTDLRAKCVKGQTALHRACWGGSTAAVRLLLNQNSEIDTEDTEGNIPLHIAAHMGFEPIVALLIKRNSPVNAIGCNKLTPLHYAAINGHGGVGKLLLKKGAKPNAREKKIGWTPLHCAAALGDTELVKSIIAGGADVRKKDRQIGWTPIHLAAMNGHNQVLRLLVKNGADYQARDSHGWTPQQLAETNRKLETAELLSAKDGHNFTTTKQWTSLHCIALEGPRQLLSFVVRKGVDVISKDEKFSPLLFAAKNGFVTALKRILEVLETPNLETKDNSGNTLLSVTAANGHEAAVDLLLKKGAKFNVRDADGLTPISNAAKGGHTGVVEMLLEKGARAKGEKYDHLVPLSWAARMGHMAVVELLLDRGAMVNGNEIGSHDDSGSSSDEENHDQRVVRYGIDDEKQRDYDGYLDRMISRWEDSDDESISSRHQSDDGRSWRKKAKRSVIRDGEMTPLSWAAKMGHKAVAELLLQRGANVKGLSGEESPMSWAARKGHEEVVELLLQHGANFKKGQEDDPYTPLSWAAVKGYKTVAEVLLREGAEVDQIDTESDDCDSRGWTPLHNAARKGRTDMVALLLEKGASTKATDEDGATALALAIEHGHTPVVELLLENGAMIEGGCYLMDSDADSDDESSTGIEPLGLKVTPLQFAVGMGQPDIVELLLRKGADIKVKGPNSKSVLTLAMEFWDNWDEEDEGGEGDERDERYEGVVEVLLQQKGVDIVIEERDCSGRTALIYAFEKKKKGVVQMLLRKGANTESKDQDGRTLLILSIENGDDDMAVFLIQGGANIEAREKNGQTPLLVATGKGNASTVALLLEKGANPEAVDKYKRTALLYATEKEDRTIAALLIRGGADVEARNKDGRTALVVATRKGYEDIAALLLEEGANTEVVDKYRRTPLVYATKRGHEAILTLLLQKGRHNMRKG